MVSLGRKRGGEIQLGGLLGWRDTDGELGSFLGRGVVAQGEAGSRDEVGNVDDRAQEDLVEPLP